METSRFVETTDEGLNEFVEGGQNTKKKTAHDASKEQRELCCGDVKLEQTPDGKEYLEYSVERQTKLQLDLTLGSDPRDTQKIKPRMYSAPDLPAERDPVRVYTFYASKPPEGMKTMILHITWR